MLSDGAISVNVEPGFFPRAIRYGDSYPWERGAELCNVQVSHQGHSETVGEHQVRGNCIHYRSVRHGTASECKGDIGYTKGRDTRTNTQWLYNTADHMNVH